jgi:uncharacterized protein (DUF433 family)
VGYNRFSHVSLLRLFVNHIEMRDGQAVIRGRGHLKARMVARKYIWEGQSVQSIMDHYQLSAAQVHAAIAYYYDNQAELDAEYERTVTAYRDQALTLDDFRAKHEK